MVIISYKIWVRYLGNYNQAHASNTVVCCRTAWKERECLLAYYYNPAHKNCPAIITITPVPIICPQLLSLSPNRHTMTESVTPVMIWQTIKVLIADIFRWRANRAYARPRVISRAPLAWNKGDFAWEGRPNQTAAPAGAVNA